MRRWAWWSLCCALGALLTLGLGGCSAPDVSRRDGLSIPTPVAVLRTATDVPEALAPSSTPTAQPSATRQHTPTVCQSPTASATAAPTQTATASPTATRTPPLWDRLQQATLPARDDRALAVALGRVEAAALTAATPAAPVYRLGDTARFWVGDATTAETWSITATLRVQLESVQMWVEQGAEVEQAGLERSAALFDETILPALRGLFGHEHSPGVDGDPHLVVLNAYFLGASGYFSAANALPRAVNPTSNEREMFVMNLHDQQPGTNTYDSVLTHELQHMIHWCLDPDEQGWLQEGGSALAQDLLGYVWSAQVAVPFAAEPDVQLNAWTDQASEVFRHYGKSFMFMRYLYERLGPAGVRALVNDPRNGLDSVDAAVRAAAGAGLDETFADWLVANAVNDSMLADGRYGYADLSLRVTPLQVVGVEPLLDVGAVQQYGADYYAFDSAAWAGRVARVTFHGETLTRLAPTQPTSGRHMWTSLWGDGANATLERTFDLRAVTSATLAYNVWFDIERGWDYAYVRASADGGDTWQLLRGAHMSDHDPTGSALGAGYTGLSGVPDEAPGGQAVWVREELDLSDYCGGEVLVRFDSVTDDAYTRAGLCVDDLAVEAIGWADDVEAGEQDWRAQGFLRHDNALPQRYLVQWVMVGVGEQGLEITRLPVDEAGNGDWELQMPHGVREAWLIVSAITPWSREPAPYRLEISAP